MLFIQDISYIHPDGEMLFGGINLNIDKKQKLALVGNNGSGKSTLLKIIAGQLPATSGKIISDSKPLFIPQIFGQFDDLTVAEALGVDSKLSALYAINQGDVSESNLDLLDDDWAIEEKIQEAFSFWQLQITDTSRKLATLSGGQKTRVFLAAARIAKPEILLLDEPGNHLDKEGLDLLRDQLVSFPGSFILVSHDRSLLNLVQDTIELNKGGLKMYGGNYTFYREQKRDEEEALREQVRELEKTIRKAKALERETLERQQKREQRGRKQKIQSGLPTISMNTFRNNAEKTSAKLKSVHQEKSDSINKEFREQRNHLYDQDQMKLNFDQSGLHQGKLLIEAKDLNFGYSDQLVWPDNLQFRIFSGERISISGRNGSGKSTLIRLILKELQPSAGYLFLAEMNTIYIDQDYSLIQNQNSILEQAFSFNITGLQDHEIKIRLHRFLFDKNDWDKPCSGLSGGERMRLALCCLNISSKAPDLIVLDEPTNNLDIQNIEILTHSLSDFRGTLIVVSHDEVFKTEIGITRDFKIP